MSVGSAVSSSWLGSSLVVIRGIGGSLRCRLWWFPRNIFFFAFNFRNNPGLRWILGKPASSVPPNLLCRCLSAVQPKKPRTPPNTIQWGAQLSLARADKLNNNFSLDSLTKSPRNGREIALIQIKTNLSARNMGQCEEEGDTSEHLHSAWCRTHWWWCRGVRPCVNKNSEFSDRVKGQELL